MFCWKNTGPKGSDRWLSKHRATSNLELLRILCMLFIIGDHLTGQGGIADYSTLPSSFAFCLIGCGSRIACSVFVLIGSWFLCEQPFPTRRPLSLWLSLWLYTVPVTLLCAVGGLPVSFGDAALGGVSRVHPAALVYLGLPGAAGVHAAAQSGSAWPVRVQRTGGCCGVWRCR